MKSIAIFVAASLLLEMLAPTLAHATQHSQGTQVEGNTRSETAEKAGEVAEQVVQWLYEKDVRVMSRGEIDPSKLRKGWYAHVVYTSEGIKETATGEILDKDADGIVIQPRGRNWEREIAYGDIDIVVVAKDQRDIEGWIEAGEVIQQLQKKESRVRFKAPSISRGWIVGRLVKVSPDTFKIFTERGFDYVPHSQISNLEVRIGRRRNTGKGMIIGLGLGLAFVVPVVIADARGSGEEVQGFATAFAILVGCPSIFVSCTLIGFMIKSDRWAEVPPQRVNLSISPTPTRGLRTALSFNF